jgi:hypothetical protein
MVGKKKVISTKKPDVVLTVEKPEQKEEVKEETKTKKRVKSSSTSATKTPNQISEVVEDPPKKRKVVKSKSTTQTVVQTEQKQEVQVHEEKQQDTNEQNEQQLCESFQDSLQLDEIVEVDKVDEVVEDTNTATNSFEFIDAPIILERNVQIPDNVIAPSKQQNNPNNFYLYHELEQKSKMMPPLSSLEFTDLLKSLRNLNEAGQHMIYLLIRTYDIHNKNKQQNNLFSIPFNGEIINQNKFSSSNEVDIQYDLKHIPSQLQNILKLFVFRHTNMMHELKEYSETSRISQLSF